MTSSPQSLSVVLPVCNAAGAVSCRLTDLLEILPDLTSQFEILVVDTGSTDPTEEIAHEIAREYPQIRVIRISSDESDDVLRLAVDQTRGEMVVVFDNDAPIRSNQLHEMWQLRDDKQLIMARPNRTNRGSLIDRLKSWAEGLPQELDESADAAGFQLLRRKGLEELPDSNSPNPPRLAGRQDAPRRPLRPTSMAQR